MTALRSLLLPVLLSGLAACAPRVAKPDAPEAVSRSPAKRPAPARRPATPRPETKAFLGEGIASFYGPGLHGRLTANGERFDQNAMTAAHRKLRFNTCVRVVNLANGRQVRLRVNDRGPYIDGRIIDVSKAAAAKLDMLEKGIARVRIYRCEEEAGAKASPERGGAG